MFWKVYAVLLGTSLSLTQARRLVTLEHTPDLPNGWTYFAPAQLDQPSTIELRVALKQPKIGELKSRLLDISTPSHPDYGRHLTRGQLGVYRAPRDEAVRAVSKWVESWGLPLDSPPLEKEQDGWIYFNASMGQIKRELNADLAWYTHEDDSGRPVIRTQTYSVPEDLREFIDFIYPLSYFKGPVRSRLQCQPPSQPLIGTNAATVRGNDADDYLQCSKGVQPECLKLLYQINYTTAATPSPARFGIAGFLEQSISRNDVKAFMSAYGGQAIPNDYTYTVELVGADAANDESKPGIEAALDVEYGLALAYPANVTYYLTAGRGAKLDANGTEVPLPQSDNEPYLLFLEYLLAKPDGQLPHVLSISYADDEQSVPRAYAERVCDAFAQLAARGVSVLAATGDGGSRGTGQNRCLSNDAERRRMTIPTFPASCPYVTAVGATSNEGPPVEAAFFSTGGFSNYFARPSWQDEDGVVARYVAGLDGSKDGMYNASGRAIPDVSAVGASFAIRWDGRTTSVVGTSASTPVVAAMVALVNDARLRAGKPPTGWLNPALYSAAVRGALSDVTEGRNQGCWYEDVGTVPGWPAAEGYDAVTGLGTPSTFEKLFAALG